MLLLPLILFSQNLDGNWKGKLTQESGGTRQEYNFELVIVVINGVVNGTSKISYIDNPKVNATMVFNGSFANNEMVVQEYRFLDNNNEQNMSWCIKKMVLKFSQNTKNMFLTGSWTGKSSYSECAPGKISVSKPIVNENTTVAEDKNNPQPKKVIIPKTVQNRTLKKDGDTLFFNTKQITISVYDHKSEDNDTISLQYNGKWILKNYPLSNIPRKIKLTLQEKQLNYLLLFAENLGKIPPNTAAISFDGLNMEPIILRSDLKQCDVIYFKVKK